MWGKRSGMARVNGVDLAWESFGPDEAPAIVLVCGAGTSREWWRTEFCQRIAVGDASGPRRVIRYDLRDAGQSTTGRPGDPDYSGVDLADDLAALVDELVGAPAHLVGMSFGGGLVQKIAVRHPDAVASITLLSTSPVGPDAGADELPPPTDAVAATFDAEPAEPDWTDARSVAKHLIEGERPYAGSIPMDVDGIADIAAEVVARAGDQRASANHFMIDDGGVDDARISSIRVPTLVMHGSEDPLFPLPQGERLAELIPDARLIVLPGHGHQYPPPQTWDLVVAEILRHTAH